MRDSRVITWIDINGIAKSVVTNNICRSSLGTWIKALKCSNAVRYSSEGKSRTLYHSKSMEALRKINPEFRERFSSDARAIVSEPLDERMSEDHDFWEVIPESSAVILEAGEVTVYPFEPRLPR